LSSRKYVMDAEQIEARVRQEVAAVLDRDGTELVEVEFVREHGRWVLRLVVDREEGVNLEDCERVSRLVSPILDVADPIEVSYVLEVSSPGINRPLVRMEDFERFAGERVRITTHYLHEGRRRFKGELVGVEKEEVVVRINGDTYRIPHADIKKAHLAPRL